MVLEIDHPFKFYTKQQLTHSLIYLSPKAVIKDVFSILLLWSLIVFLSGTTNKKLIFHLIIHRSSYYYLAGRGNFIDTHFSQVLEMHAYSRSKSLSRENSIVVTVISSSKRKLNVWSIFPHAGNLLIHIGPTFLWKITPRLFI